MPDHTLADLLAGYAGKFGGGPGPFIAREALDRLFAVPAQGAASLVKGFSGEKPDFLAGLKKHC